MWANLIVKALTTDLLWLRLILPVNVRSVMIKSRCRHSHHVAVDTLNTGLQNQDFYPWIFRQTAGKNTTSCASSNWKTKH